jgi:TetR/AcrR family transcriptional regulator, transcriptional repressor for nem operon
MNPTPGRKALTHDRILDTAARAIRRAGCGGVGVADIMKEAGLTHGGFYAHFPSRDALLVEALDRAGRDSVERIEARVARRTSKELSPLSALVRAYLSDEHAGNAEHGCPVAALVSEMPRQAPEVQEAGRVRVSSLIECVRRCLPAGADPQQALVITSTLVGALQLARAMGAGPQAKAVLKSSRDALLAQFDAPSLPSR